MWANVYFDYFFKPRELRLRKPLYWLHWALRSFNAGHFSFNHDQSKQSKSYSRPMGVVPWSPSSRLCRWSHFQLVRGCFPNDNYQSTTHTYTSIDLAARAVYLVFYTRSSPSISALQCDADHHTQADATNARTCVCVCVVSLPWTDASHHIFESMWPIVFVISGLCTPSYLRNRWHDKLNLWRRDTFVIVRLFECFQSQPKLFKYWIRLMNW